MSVQCLEPKFYAIFLETLGLADDPDFADQFDRSAWPGLSERLETIFAGRTQAVWQTLFESTDACVAPVLTPEQSLAHPINKSRGAWHDVQGVLQAAPAPRFADAESWSPPPVAERGAHTQQILNELDQGAD